MPDNPVSEPFDGESAWPTDPDEDWFEDPDAYLERVGHDWPGEPDEAWVSDPDAYLEEVVGYMKRLYALCEGSDEFVAALKGLFPELEEKVAQGRALDAEEIGDDDLDPRRRDRSRPIGLLLERCGNARGRHGDDLRPCGA